MRQDERVVIGEAVALDLRLAGVGSRGVAAVIDLAIAQIAQVLALVVFLVVGAHTNAAALTTIILVIEVGVIVGYPVGAETLFHGKTIGKKIMGLRVVRDDGGPIRFRHALARGLIGVIIEKPGAFLAVPALVGILSSSRNKRVGDLAAGTIVVQERVPSAISAPVEMPPALAGWAAGLDLSAVDDTLALRLRQYLSRISQLTPAARMSVEQQLADDLVARVGAPPPHTPGWAVVAAVLAERRRRAFAAQHAGSATPGVGAQPALATSPIPWGASIPSPLPSYRPASPDPTTSPATLAPVDLGPPPPPSTTGFAPPA